MNWFREFKGQAYGTPFVKHKSLPIYITNEFDFFRCVEFKSDFYGKTASVLFNGNLRMCSGRYSKLFPNQKISYWANSLKTARAEIKKHGASNDILSFWAYDDGTSAYPTLPNQAPLKIIDGRQCGAQRLIDKADKDLPLDDDEAELLQKIIDEEPDCLAYDSHAIKGGENYIFFERGFRKLALRELRLRFDKNNGGNHNRIVCATTCDYFPSPEAYGKFFAFKSKVKMDLSYLQSDEYLMRRKILDCSYKRR